MTFDAPGFAWAIVSVSSQVGQNSQGRRADDDEQALLALADMEADNADSAGLDFVLVRKSVKDYGAYEGYTIESKSIDEFRDKYDSWAAKIAVTVLLEPDGSIRVVYGRAGTQGLTLAEHYTLGKLVGSIRMD